MIDLQRIAAQVAEPYPVSARMIYECARLKRDRRRATTASRSAT